MNRVRLFDEGPMDAQVARGSVLAWIYISLCVFNYD